MMRWEVAQASASAGTVVQMTAALLEAGGAVRTTLDLLPQTFLRCELHFLRSAQNTILVLLRAISALSCKAKRLGGGLLRRVANAVGLREERCDTLPSFGQLGLQLRVYRTQLDNPIRA